MSIHRLFAILVALTVLVAPAFTRAGEAFAAVPDHHAQMLTTGHCQDATPGSEQEEGSAAQSCCIAMCMAVAATPPTALAEKDLLHSPAVYIARAFKMGLPAEIATPPPRLA